MRLDIMKGIKINRKKKFINIFAPPPSNFSFGLLMKVIIFWILRVFFFVYIFSWMVLFYNGSTTVYCTRSDCVDTSRMPTMKATSCISSPRFFNSVIFYFLFCFIMFIKYIKLFILQLTILELFEAIEFGGNFEKLSYFDHLYLAMEGSMNSFVEWWMLFSWIIKIFIP